MSPVYLLCVAVSFFIKRTCCKILHEKYGDKSVRYFRISSLLLCGFILLSILRISPENYMLFSILNGFAWGFIFGQ